MIEIRSNGPLDCEEVRNIIQERFLKISTKRNIVGIIENTNGFVKNVKKIINNEIFSILLTQGNSIVRFNNHANRDPQIKKCFLSDDEVSTENGFQVLEIDKDFKMLSLIINGCTRVLIYKCLLSGPSYAYKIVKDLHLNNASVSRTLQEMKGAGVIECITPCQRKKKFYILTTTALVLKGDVLSYVQSMKDDSSF